MLAINAPSGFALRDNVRGILAMIAAMFALTTNFAFVKLAGATVPVGEILFLRGLIAALIIAAVAYVTGALRRLPSVLHRTVLFRTAFENASAVIFVVALMATPIADATVILQAMPLVITAGAALWLGETVSWRRWAAVAVGFVGVLIVIRPGLTAFDWASLLVLAAVFLSSFRDLATRRVPEGIPTVLVALVALSSLSLVGLALAVFEDWTVPSGLAFFHVAGSGVLLSLGLFFVVLSMRRGELSIIAPFRYSAVLWAVILGYLWWGEAPDLLTIVGGCVIVASGVYISYRERRLRATLPALQTDTAATVIRQDDRADSEPRRTARQESR